MEYLKAFVVGGLLCVIGQILVDKTKLTPARILVGFVVAGVVLGALGLYQPLADFAGAGATVPLSGFGNLLVKGTKEAVDSQGLLGALTGLVWSLACTLVGYKTVLRLDWSQTLLGYAPVFLLEMFLLLQVMQML